MRECCCPTQCCRSVLKEEYSLGVRVWRPRVDKAEDVSGLVVLEAVLRVCCYKRCGCESPLCDGKRGPRPK